MRTILVIPCLALLLALPAAAQKACTPNSSCLPEEPEPVLCNLFKGALLFETAGGIGRGRVVLQDWQIANGVTADIPHQGLFIVHLRAGALTTEIGDERAEWQEGSYWSVPAGRSMIVHTGRESVALQTMDFITQ